MEAPEGMTKTEIEKQAFKLPEPERRELGVRLIESTLPNLTQAQQELIHTRIQQHDRDPSSSLSQEEFDACLDERLSRGA